MVDRLKAILNASYDGLLINTSSCAWTHTRPVLVKALAAPDTVLRPLLSAVWPAAEPLPAFAARLRASADAASLAQRVAAAWRAGLDIEGCAVTIASVGALQKAAGVLGEETIADARLAVAAKKAARANALLEAAQRTQATLDEARTRGGASAVTTRSRAAVESPVASRRSGRAGGASAAAAAHKSPPPSPYVARAAAAAARAAQAEQAAAARAERAKRAEAGPALPATLLAMVAELRRLAALPAAERQRLHDAAVQVHPPEEEEEDFLDVFRSSKRKRHEDDQLPVLSLMENVLISADNLEVFTTFLPDHRVFTVQSSAFGTFNRSRLFFATGADAYDDLAVLPPELAALLPRQPSPAVLAPHLPAGTAFACLTSCGYFCTQNAIDECLRTLLDASSPPDELLKAATLWRKNNATLDLRSLRGSQLGIRQALAGQHMDPAFYDAFNALPDVRVAGPLTAAEMRRCVGEGIDVAVLVRFSLAHLATLARLTDVRSLRLWVVSLFDGTASALWALLHLRTAGVLRRIDYLAFDINPVSAAAKRAYFERLGLPKEEVSFTVVTCDLSKLTKAAFYEHLRTLGGRPHLFYGGPPCSDLSRLNRYAEGVWGPKSRLFVHYFRLLVAAEAFA